MKIKAIKDRMKEYFFLHPTVKLRVRQIERTVKAPLPSVIRYTKELTQEAILKQSEVAQVKTYSADRISRTFLFEKKFFNIKQLFDVGLMDFIIQELSSPIIIVFGSYFRGEDVENSDIDLYVQTPTKKTLNLERFEKKLQRKIQLFVYKSIKDIGNKELANSIVNGSTLNGFLEVFT